MKNRLDKAIVEFVPENPAETAELGNTKQLEPMGVYQPTENNVARFHLNGLTAEEEKAVPVFLAPYDTDVYCATCNKVVHVKKGEQIPICCGKLMEILD